MRALIKVLITSPANIDEELKKYPTLRMYLSEFQRTPDGGFISQADLVKKPNGKYALKDEDSFDLKLSLLDWGFNEESVLVDFDDEGRPECEPGDAHKFFEEHSEGFKWSLKFLCEI